MVGLIKFFLFVLLIPLIIGMTSAFIIELKNLSRPEYHSFQLGILVYIITHFFIYEFNVPYQYGKKLVSDIVRFFEPLVKFAPLVMPIYTLLLLIVFYFTKLLSNQIHLSSYFLFLTSLSFAMHMIFTARDLRAQDTMAFKPNYLFSMAFVYALNIILITLMLHFIFRSFSFINFFQGASYIAGYIYQKSFQQLF